MQVIGTHLFISFKGVDISFGFYPHILHIEIDLLTFNIIIINILGLDFRVCWSGQQGYEDAKSVYEMVRKELESND